VSQAGSFINLKRVRYSCYQKLLSYS